MIFIWSGLLLTIVTSFLLSDSVQPSSREQKLLNVFTIVNFPNSACNTTDNTYGVCYTSTECSALGGSNAGSCASGFGVCCSLSGNCGGSTTLNNTYFSSSSADTSPCKFTVCKCSTDICQIKLNFDTFSIDQPNSSTSTDDKTPKTQCTDSQFTAASSGSNSANTICGTNTGYHMYLEASESCNTLEFTWTSTTSKSWKIHIMQIPCDAEWKAPAGCTQYFTGTTGTVYSYNYQSSLHIANQNYQNCIRTEEGYCSISYAAIAFSVSSTPPVTTSLVDTACTMDYVLIPQGSTTTTSIASLSRYCGVFLNPAAATAANAAVVTQAQPFQIGVVFDATEVSNPAATGVELGTIGFAIGYTQSTTC